MSRREADTFRGTAALTMKQGFVAAFPRSRLRQLQRDDAND